MPRKSDTLEAFEKTLNEMGDQGWEYCGSESLISTNPLRKAQWGTGPTLVFKRPKGANTGETLPSAGMQSSASNRFGASPKAPTSRNNGYDPFNGASEKPKSSSMPGNKSAQAGRGEVTIVRLQNADATEMARILSLLFADHGKVLADFRTNSLLIQSDKEMALEMAAVIQKLDVPPAKPDHSVNPAK